MTAKLKITRQLSFGARKPTEIEIQFEDTAGSIQTVRYAKSILTNLKLLHQQLIDANADLDIEYKVEASRMKTLQASVRTVATEKLARIGWSDDLSEFSFPTRIISRSTQVSSQVAPANVDPDWQYKLPVSGTSAGWADAIKPASKSSALIFVAATSFVPPCLRLLNRPSFGFMLHGRSKRGKSTATLLGASAYGFQDEESLPSFSATQTALGELGATFNDMILPINEFGTATGSAKEQAAFLKTLAYQRGEGKTKSYSRIAQRMGNVERSLPARCVLLANNELSAGQIARASRLRRLEGEAIRLMDLPICAPNHDTMFDLSKTPNNIALSKKRCLNIRDGVREHHGFASRKFVKFLVRNKRRAKAELLKAMDDFSNYLPSEPTSAEEHHMADNFALIYAAGLLAVRRKILPFTEIQIRGATIECLKRVSRSLPSEDNRAQDAFDALNADFLAGVFPREIDLDRDCFAHEDGYLSADGELVLRGEYLAQRFSSENEAYLLVRKLHSLGLLHKKIMVPTVPTNSIRWAQVQKTWPDGNRRRSIVIDTN